MTKALDNRRALSVIDAVEAAMEKAAASCDPVSIFRGWSETEVIGTPVEAEQGNLVAFMALTYYLESLAEKPVTFAQLKDWKDRAEALKSRLTDPAMICAVDDLISAAGRGLDMATYKTLEGEHHALVAAYRLYGDVSRAYELLDWSGGVSGACITDVQYR